MPRINLCKAQIQELNYERYQYPSPIVQRRISAVYFRAILDCSNSEIERLSDINRNAVGYWTNVYLTEGLAGLSILNYGTNVSKLERYSGSILQSFTDHPPMNVSEAKARIEEMTGISRSLTQVRAFMKKHGLRYIKTGHIPAKADSEKQQDWVKNILRPVVEEAKNGDCHLLFLDAAHFILQPFICALWCVARLFIKASAGRNRINVLGAVHAVTKEVHTLINTTFINAETIIDFLKQLKTQYGDKPIKIVLDNARYQHCKIVEDQAKELGITLLFLPPYSPNLNIIERLWKFTKKNILYAKYYQTPALFHHAVSSFFQTINKIHNQDLKKLLTLNFQFFDKQNAIIYPV
jgi:transposase